MKHYALKFCQDHGDEFNVHALTCFTEEEYQEWLTTSILDLDPDYESKYQSFLGAKEKYDNFIEGMKERGLYNKPMSDFTKEEFSWYRENKAPYVYNAPSNGTSKLYAYLGNYTDGFSEQYERYETCQDLVDEEIVTVQEVSEQFYKTFIQLELGIAMCNVFELIWN